MNPIYVILIDGYPYTGDHRHIRTYKTIARAKKEIERIQNYHCYRSNELLVAEFGAQIIMEVSL